MASPSSRSELADYCRRQLGAPVLEINVADEQVDDIIDDAVQYFQERHFDGVAQAYLKYKITQDDIDRGRASMETNKKQTGITTTTATADIAGTDVTFTYYENSNFLQILSYLMEMPFIQLPLSVFMVLKLCQYKLEYSIYYIINGCS